MNNKLRINFIWSIFLLVLSTSYNETKKSAVIDCPVVSANKSAKTKKIVIKIIVGSIRTGRVSEKIAAGLKQFADKRDDIVTEIIDLRDYNVPFLSDEISPSSRTEIKDPIVKKWSEKITNADAFIVVVPEYNSGYPGVLKNALDSLYKEWNNKPVAFVGHSGGPSGGAAVIAQLRQVATALKMIPVPCHITIPYSWKAFDAKDDVQDKSMERTLSTCIDQLIDAVSKKINKIV